MPNSFFNNEYINEVVKDKLERELLEYKNIKYAYAIMNKRNPAHFAVISNKKEWFDVYSRNHFQFIDPVLLAASNRVSPFSWDENIMSGSGLKFSTLFNIVKEHNVVTGYTFVLHDHHNNLVVLSLIMDNQNNYIANIEKDQNKLQMLLIAMHEKLTTLYREVNSPSYFERINSSEVFSERENEVLYWASMGKSYQEIALLLGVKLTTIKYHVSNAVKKLGVANAKHAIRLGMELQLIRPVLPRQEK